MNILIVVLVLGAIGFFVWKKKSSSSSTNGTTGTGGSDRDSNDTLN